MRIELHVQFSCNLTAATILMMAEGGSGPSISSNISDTSGPSAKKRKRECHFDCRWLKEFEIDGIKKSSRGIKQ